MPIPKCPQFESTIGMYSFGSGLKARLAGPLVRRRIPLVHQAIQFRRQRINRQRERVVLVDGPIIERATRPV